MAGTHNAFGQISTLGGIPIPPSAETDFIEHDFPTEMTVTEGMSGPVWNQTSKKKTAGLRYRALADSDQGALLGALLQVQRQRLSLGTFTGFSYSYRDTNTGSWVNASDARFVQAPGMMGGEEHAEDEWELRLGGWSSQHSAGHPAFLGAVALLG